MATTILPPAPPPESHTAPSSARFVTINADLLPPEITAKRRLAHLKRRILFGLVALVVVLVAWYALAMLRTSQANSDLSSAQHQNRVLQVQQQQFGPLVAAQAKSAAIKTQLTKLMIGDVRWKDMLATLRQNATPGIQITSISASMSSGALAAGSGGDAGLGVLNESGKRPVGTLAITGTAPDKNAVAAYVDKLSQVTGLAAPFPASVTGDKGALIFTVNVIITSDALGGRYATNRGGH